jgi:ABC-type thiamine transport system substrate-binding protein
VFTKFAETAPKPWTLPAADISAHRDAWIEQWTETVLR